MFFLQFCIEVDFKTASTFVSPLSTLSRLLQIPLNQHWIHPIKPAAACQKLTISPEDYATRGPYHSIHSNYSTGWNSQRANPLQCPIASLLQLPTALSIIPHIVKTIQQPTLPNHPPVFLDPRPLVIPSCVTEPIPLYTTLWQHPLSEIFTFSVPPS